MSEITFELSALQYELMGYPGLRQGQSLDLILDAGLLFPERDAPNWYYVRPEPLPAQLLQVSPGRYAFAGQIKDAEMTNVDDIQEATLLVECGKAPVRVVSASQSDGRLPWGTWETRFLTGFAPLQGIVEDDFSTSIGQSVGVIIWAFQRLVLTPGDPLFGQWFETTTLPSSPFGFDRILIHARLHNRTLHENI